VAPVTLLLQVLAQLERAEPPVETVLFGTPFNADGCLCLLGDESELEQSLDHQRGWVTVLQRARRGILGVAPLPRVGIDVISTSVSDRGRPQQRASDHLSLHPLLVALDAAKTTTPAVLEMADEAPLERLSDLLDTLQTTSFTRALLLVDGYSGYLLQMKEPTRTSDFVLRYSPRSIPAPSPAETTPRPWSHRTPTPRLASTPRKVPDTVAVKIRRDLVRVGIGGSPLPAEVYTRCMVGSSAAVIERMDPAMAAVLKEKSCDERLAIGFAMWRSARDMATNVISALHPQWSSEEISREVARRLAHDP
jgi:hypothetical protein